MSLTAEEERRMEREDLALLSRVLVWRVGKAAPVVPRIPDVPARLRRAGDSFRRRIRPLSRDELREVVRRLTAVQAG